MAGTPQSQWDISGAGDSTIVGFATAQSVNAGSTIAFKIQTDAPAYQIQIYRMGYYGGSGARLVTTIRPSAPLPQRQPACYSDPSVGLTDCGTWNVSASWAVPSSAVSGIYFAKLIRTDTGGANHIVFVVRNDSNNSDIIFQTSDNTWQAYNSWGGQSLYGCSTDLYNLDCRAHKVSFNRPYRTRPDANGSWVFYAEYPMVRWLEANGYNVGYISEAEAAKSSSFLTSHKVYMSVGHDEYWDGTQRANVEAARAAGVNLAFFSGNEVFWKTRWENSYDGTNTPYRTLVCYKETIEEAQEDPADPPTWTGTWMDPTFSPPADGGRPPNALTGTLFRVNAEQVRSIVIPYAQSKLRFWRNTAVAALQPGQSYSTPAGTLGYEFDVDEDNGFRPAGLFDLSSNTLQIVGDYLVDYGGTYGNGIATHSLTLYRYLGKALVFGSGTVQWPWGLDSTHDSVDGPVNTDPAMQQATVNLLADMGAQPVSLQSGLRAATQSTDTTAPTSTITSPTNGSTLAANTPLTVRGPATDTGGGIVAGVEVSIDGANTWHPASGTSSWNYTFTPASGASYTIRSRAVDDSGNLETPSAGVTVGAGSSPPPAPTNLTANAGNQEITLVWSASTGAATYNVKRGTTSGGAYSTVATGVTATQYVDKSLTNGTTYFYVVSAVGQGGESPNSSQASARPQQPIAGCPSCSTIWPSSTTPVIADATWDSQAVELGVVFRPDTNGYITGIRFYKGSGNTGTHVGNLWTAGGMLLASALFTGETASGWQQVNFGTPVPVTANTIYVASYFAPRGNFARDGNYFTSAGVYNSPLYALSDPEAGGNGIYSYSSTSTFPTVTSGDAPNYWVDVIFSTTTSTLAPPSGLIANGSNGRVTLRWISSGNGITYTVQRSTVNGGPYTPIASGLSTTNYVDTGLTNGTLYYYIVTAKNSQSQTANSAQVSARPAQPIASCGTCFTIWQTSAAPGTPDATWDSDPVELGVIFQAETAGSILGIRFYKGTGNTGTHIGNLWTTTGTRLATATFTSETASGWQQVMFATPVAVAANGTYIASYFAPHGNYAMDENYFASAGFDNSPLHALSTPATGGNGVFTYNATSAFPTETWASSNYWVDVIFQPGNAIPPAPTGLSATSGNAQVVLSWTAVSGASSYNVQRSTTSGGPYTTVGTPTASNFTDTGLTNGTTYYYVVAAVNSAGTSPNSTQLGATPNAAPTAPTGLGATPGNAQVALSWTAVSGATSYKVQRSTTSGGPYTSVGTPTASNFTDTGLTNGTTYYYVVAAVNSVGTGSNSAQVSATPTAGSLPTAPTGLSATPGNAQVALSWTAVSGATSYKVQRSTISGGPYTSVGTPTASTFTDTGLSNGTVYYYTVAAVNSAGSGPNSAQVSATPTAGSVPSCPPCFSIWSSTAVPATPDATWDSQPVELGVAFQTMTNGYITGIRFYKGTGNTGTHIGNLWNSSGANLARATFSGETASGWQQVNFATPVAVSANRVYVASYFAPRGNYPQDVNYFATAGVVNSPLQVLADSQAPAGNGVYAYSATSAFPNTTYSASNFWVDVVFQTTAPQGVRATPTSGQVSLSWTAVSGASSYNVKRATVSGGPYATVASSTTASYTDTGLTNGSTYYYVVTAVTSQGESPNSVETAASTPPSTAPTCPCSTIWSSTARPGTPDATWDSLPVELGVVFQPASNGYILGVRFYKGSGNTGTHVGNLWSSKGTLLATATFTGETASGWQQVTFARPVAVSANTTYVVSYLAPHGNYARDDNYFESAVSNPPLSALSNAQAVSSGQAGNGVYWYNNIGGFPATTSGDAPNYWVDVLFKPSP